VKKIIIVVLILMFVIPLFNIDVYRDPENSWDYHLQNQLQLLLQNPAAISTAAINEMINSTISTYLSEQNCIILYSTPFN